MKSEEKHRKKGNRKEGRKRRKETSKNQMKTLSA
jgi:hypothetical protein